MNEKVKKTIRIAVSAVTWVIVAFAVFMMAFTIFNVAAVDKNDRDLFGIRFYIVTSNSMSLSEKNADLDVHFDAGDMIIVNGNVDPLSLEEGDVLSFISTNSENYGETVTHMVYKVVKNGDKVVGYHTIGTNTGHIDEAVVEPSYVLGKYVMKIPAAGNFFKFVKTTPGYMLCIFLPFLLLILYNGGNVIVLFRRYKKEQNQIIEAERAEIEAERKQNEQMLRELQALKAQLQSQAAAPAEDADAPAETGTDAPAETDTTADTPDGE